MLQYLASALQYCDNYDILIYVVEWLLQEKIYFAIILNRYINVSGVMIPCIVISNHLRKKAGISY